MPNLLLSMPSRELHFVEQTLEFHEEIGVLSTVHVSPAGVVEPDRSLSEAQIAEGQAAAFRAFLDGMRQAGVDIRVLP